MKWMFILGLSLYVGGNLYVYLRMLQALAPMHTLYKILFTLGFWLAAFALFASIALRDAELPHAVQRAMFVVGSVWMAFVLYMVLATLVADLLHLIFPTFGHRVWYALGATILLLAGGYINYRIPHIERLSLEVEKSNFRTPQRIVAISDVHLGYGTTRHTLARYVDKINDLEADVVVIVGDLIDNSVAPVEREAMCDEFSRLRAPEGVYMVAGNHEYISGIDAVERYLASTRVHLVRDSVVSLPCGIELLCRDDRSNRRRQSIAELLAEADSSRPIVVLDHQPYDIEQSAATEIVDLHLSGHTHRGQVWPISWLTDAIYKQSYGYRMWGSMHAYVSSGLSLWGPPFRIGTHSEIVVIDLHAATPQSCKPMSRSM